MDTQTQRQVAATLKFGGKVLCLRAETQRGWVETEYLVDARPGRVDLVTDEEGREGEVYTVTPGSCTCKAWWFVNRLGGGACKHILALREVGILPKEDENIAK